MYRSFTSLVRFIQRYFTHFEKTMSGIVFLISLSVSSLLAYNNATDFWRLTLYPATFFWIYLLIMLLQLSHFCPFTQLHPAHHLPPTFPPYSSCPWVILISSLASTFPTLFLPSPCLFSTYHLCSLFSVPFPPLSASHSPVDNPPCDLHLYGSVPVLLV